MPFGLASAPATFQRLMSKVLADLVPAKCLVYMDDVMVHSTSINEHRRHLTEIFERFRRAGLTLNPKKCVFLKDSVTFLGHIVSKNGIHPTRNRQRRLKHGLYPLM